MNLRLYLMSVIDVYRREAKKKETKAARKPS